MANVVTDISELYKTYFQKPYYVPQATAGRMTGMYGTALKETLRGVEVMLPVRLRNSDWDIKIACATVRVSGSKTVVRTPVSERVGTVKEIYGVGDWKIDVKGVLIAEREETIPDKDMNKLRRLYESVEPVVIENAVTDLFLDTSKYVCITDLEFPEVEGKSLRCRPFTMSMESDYIKSLKVE